MEKKEMSMNDRTISIPVCDKVLTVDLTTDYTLPEYLPEARKILFAKANATDPAKYVSPASTDFSGNVEYTVYFVGADSEIYSVPITTEYGFEVPLDISNVYGSGEGINASAEVSVENTTARLIGPRKMNVKGRAKAHVRASCSLFANNLSESVQRLESIEKLEEEIPLVSILHSVSDTIEISEEIIPENENVRIIGADGNIFITNAVCSNDKLDISGEVYLTLLVSNGDKIDTIQRRTPISSDMEIEGIDPSSRCSVFGRISDISVSVLDGRIVCDISLVLSANIECTDTINYITDAYSIKNECDTVYKKLPVIKNGFCTNGNFSMNERLLKENISYPENSNIVYAFGMATVDSIEALDKKNVLSGQVKFITLIESDGDYTANEIILPLRYEFEGNGEELTSSDASITVISCRVRQDAESVSIDAELAVAAWGINLGEIMVVDNINIGNEIKKDKGEHVIYYLRPEDTLWSVGKKYHVSKDAILKKNKNIDNAEYVII